MRASDYYLQTKEQNIMENTLTLKIELPKEVIEKLEKVIIETVTQTLTQHINKIKAEPKMYTRKEAANALRITLPTLRVYELQGRLLPKRAGKRVLYTKHDIEAFIASLRP
jgi:hypothetical protein